uniref:Capsid protein n=1 Tax=Porcine associated porprismacovirus TaxID=2496634 RepID=A0A482JT57_9VIRU|nr:capsid protein [Porcine associated porprismacovirus]
MATNFVKAKFQEIYDFGTVSGRTTILGIHTPQGYRVQKLLGGFFRQFRKVKYSGCTVTMVPAAQLPADPAQVSFEAGALTVDPRDLLNPILFHGCHGESMNEILNQYLVGQTPDTFTPTGENDSVQEARPSTSVTEAGYYAALSDPSFRKFGIQSGAKVSLKPMVHPLVLTNPMVPSKAHSDFVATASGKQFYESVNGVDVGEFVDVENTSPASDAGKYYGSIQYPGGFAPLGELNAMWGFTPQMFSNGLRPLGWLPTTMYPPATKEGTVSVVGKDADTGGATNLWNADIGPTTLPKLFMGMFILPPSYTQEMYFRLIINHYFEFKDFTTCLAVNIDGPSGSYTETIPEPTTSGASSTSLEVVNGTVELTTDGVY